MAAFIEIQTGELFDQIRVRSLGGGDRGELREREAVKLGAIEAIGLAYSWIEIRTSTALVSVRRKEDGLPGDDSRKAREAEFIAAYEGWVNAWAEALRGHG